MFEVDKDTEKATILGLYRHTAFQYIQCQFSRSVDNVGLIALTLLTVFVPSINLTLVEYLLCKMIFPVNSEN